MKQRKLVALGEVQLIWGTKPQKVFSTPGERVKKEWLQHDLLLWKWLRQLPNAHVVAGTDCDPAIRADAEITFSTGFLAFAEMDCGTESLQTVEKRWTILLKRQRWLLWIALSEDRIDEFKQRALHHGVSDRIFFALWEDLLADPAYLWEDCKGNRGPLYPVAG